MEKKMTERIATRSSVIDYRSFLTWLPNPDPVLKKFGRDISMYRELLNDPHVRACVQSFKDGIRRLEWDVNRDTDMDANAQTAKAILAKMFAVRNNGGWQRIVGGILDARLYGYQPLEVIWKVGTFDGVQALAPDMIDALPPEWFSFNADTNEIMLRTKESLNGEDVPPYKFLVATNDASYDNPYGRGVLSSIFWPVTFKRGMMKLAVTYAESYGMAWLHAKHDLNDQADIDKLESALENLSQNGILVTGQGIDVNNIYVPSTGVIVYQNIIQLCKSEIAEAVLSHEGSIASTPGRLGGDVSALAVRADVIDAGRKLIEQAMNTLLVWIHEVNQWAGEPPTFGLYEPEDVDLNTAQRDQVLASFGVKFSKTYVAKTYDLEESDFEITEPQPVQQPQDGQGGEPSQFAERTGLPIETVDQLTLDEAVRAIAESEQAAEISNALVDAVVSYMEGADSYEAALDGLKNLYAEMDTDALENMLVRAISTASMLGQSYVKHTSKA